jgi:hypothetical protein
MSSNRVREESSAKVEAGHCLSRPSRWAIAAASPRPATPSLAGDHLAGELLAELPEADQRHLLQALESLRAVLARHPEL